MRILWTDQAEYYFVCDACYYAYSHMQWSGSTRSYANWEGRAMQRLKHHVKHDGRCQFCDPVIGNGGWHIGPNDDPPFDFREE